MAGFSFGLGSLEAALAETRGSGVSFESQAKKWETEEQGSYQQSKQFFSPFNHSFYHFYHKHLQWKKLLKR